ncbi:MAG: hypothetical protein MK209_08085, partial [Planctomycetes bacterium]|nr:hypothetical protein [Planctomycetota bacterium]
MRSFLLLTLSTFTQLPACASGPSVDELAELEKSQMSAALGVSVASIDPIKLNLKTRVRDNIAGHAALRKRDLWSIQFDAVTLRGSAGELMPTHVLRIPLQDPFGLGTAYFAFDREARLYALGLASEAFVNDANGLWDGFLAQFRGRSAAPTSELVTPIAAHRIFNEANDLARALYDLQRQCAENEVRSVQVITLTGRGEIPSSHLFRDWSARIPEMQNLASQAMPALGIQATRDFQRALATAEPILAQAAFAASAGQAGEVRRLIGGELPALHPVTLNATAPSAGAPPLYRVDQDIWAPALH